MFVHDIILKCILDSILFLILSALSFVLAVLQRRNIKRMKAMINEKKEWKTDSKEVIYKGIEVYYIRVIIGIAMGFYLLLIFVVRVLKCGL